MGRKSNAQKEAEAASAQQIDDEFGFDDAVGGAQLDLDDDLPAVVAASLPPPPAQFDPFAPSITAPEVQKLAERLSQPAQAIAKLVPPGPPTTPSPAKPAPTAKAKATNGAAGPVTDWKKVLPGILNQLENISRVLEGRGTPKSARAIGKLGEVLVWVNDDLRDLK